MSIGSTGIASPIPSTSTKTTMKMNGSVARRLAGGGGSVTDGSSRRSFDPIVGCFLGDLHVVHVRFAHSRGRDLDELGAAAHLVDRRAAAVAHCGPYAAHELVDDRGERALVRHASLDAFGNEFFCRVVAFSVLEITVARALLHRAQRSHPAV